MDRKSIVRADIPVFKYDFQNSAIVQGHDIRTGTRLFRDVNLRGWLFEAARARKQGGQLSAADYERLGTYPEVMLDIYYLGENTPQDAISLNGLRRVIRMGLMDEIISPNNSRNTVRAEILGDVIATKLLEQNNLAQYEVE